jgi:sugar/nucleoside kinase (ribokinase family)
VSEIDCGVVTKRVRDHLATLGERDPSKFVLADSREQIALFRNVCVKPNEREITDSVDWCMWEPESEAEDKAFALAHSTGRHVFVTRGANGIFLPTPWKRNGNSEGSGAFVVPSFPVSGPIDICGAGDSTSAGITSAMVSGATHEQAAAFGNLVASITIQQLGVTGTAPPEKVRARWREVEALANGQR